MMFLADRWFDVVQTIAIIITLIVTLHTIRDQTKVTRVSNSLLITQHHRELWTAYLAHPSLGRVFDKQADITSQPITDQEQIFVNMIFLHLSASLKAIAADAAYPADGIANDLRDLLSYPIPRHIWDDVREFHDYGLVQVIERHIAQLENG